MDISATILLGIKLRDDWYQWMEEQIKGHAGFDVDDVVGEMSIDSLYAIKKGVRWNIKDGETYESFFKKRLKVTKDLKYQLITFSRNDSSEIEFYLAIRHYEVDGCYGMELDTFNLLIHHNEPEELCEFCKFMGIEYAYPRFIIGSRES